MSNKRYGLGKEREAKKICQETGAIFVSRSRGSFGTFDIEAYFPIAVSLISVKATKQKHISWKAEIKKIRETQVPEYCQKELWIYWSPRKDRIKKGWEKIIIT